MLLSMHLLLNVLMQMHILLNILLEVNLICTSTSAHSCDEHGSNLLQKMQLNLRKRFFFHLLLHVNLHMLIDLRLFYQCT